MTAIVSGKRRGAPKKAPENSRTVKVTLLLTPTEYAWLQAEAGKAGLTRALARFLLTRAMGGEWKIIPAVNRAAWSHLGKWAGCFTTLAKAAAGGNLVKLYPHLNPSLEFLLEAVRAELRALRLALIGLDRASRQEAEEAERRWHEAFGDVVEDAMLGPDDEDEEWDGSDLGDLPDEIDPDAPLNWGGGK
ncbi:hypothetical protein [Roseicella sp. DB1501]|uniref:hypothetical protein n=1 Tax=Roseicella sp. DB1501 TaxID=2730925 RepID=UPI001491E1D7|nr:hypothetical protein [Roseicella sp. DB1501]NOG74194.1 hypothetical protein [Roseicella sp. DB1501]